MRFVARADLPQFDTRVERRGKVLDEIAEIHPPFRGKAEYDPAPVKRKFAIYELHVETVIADLLLAVNRPYGKSDYIPCICWGREAKIASDLEIGSYIKITGRIQSREYIKKLTEIESEKRIAYEVSVKKLEMI